MVSSELVPRERLHLALEGFAVPHAHEQVSGVVGEAVVVALHGHRAVDLERLGGVQSLQAVFELRGIEDHHTALRSRDLRCGRAGLRVGDVELSQEAHLLPADGDAVPDAEALARFDRNLSAVGVDHRDPALENPHELVARIGAEGLLHGGRRPHADAQTEILVFEVDV
jgi:hypothetical protein